MKILFIIKDFLIEPLGIMYLSSALKKAGHEVYLLKTIYSDYEKYALGSQSVRDGEALSSEDEILRFVEKVSPHILAYSVTTGMHGYYLKLNRMIRKNINAVSIFGGPHPTFFPEIINDEYVDFICQGEGEEAFVELVNNLDSRVNVKQIRNLWHKNLGGVYKNDLRPLIKEIDDIDFPDRDLVYQYNSSRRNPIKNFITGRGCPYDCSYCFNHSYSKLYSGKGQRVRIRSPKNVILEIAEIKKKYPLEIVYFQDDIFILSKKWLEEFLCLYKNEIKLPYHCHLRVGLFDEKTLQSLKWSGCVSVTLALESGNDYLRNKILKRNMNKKDIYASARLLHKYKISFRTENILGIPHENLKTSLETLFMNIRCRPAIGWASLYQPYPKTELGKLCQDEGLFNGDIDGIKPSFFEASILKLPQKKRIENLQKFFSIIVEFPFLLPFVFLLIQLPPNLVFNLIYKKWKNYCYSNRLYKVKQKREILNTQTVINKEI